MTTANQLDQMFDDLGIITLEAALRRECVAAHCTDYGHEQYGRIAARVVADPSAPEVAELAEVFGVQLVCVMGDEQGQYVHDDDEGRTWVTFPWSPAGPVELTPKILEHWQWINAIARDAGIAQGVLDSLPEPMRQDIMANVAERVATMTAFDAIIANSATVSDQTEGG